MACLHQSSSTANAASWVSLWLKRYAQASLTKYEQLEVQGQREGTVSVGSGSKDLETLDLMFDQEKILPAVDKLSQVSKWNKGDLKTCMLWWKTKIIIALPTVSC